LVALVRAGFRGEVLVPEEPQLVGALGAALLGAESEAGDGGAEEKR
ncbi:MAG: hypothetical protein H5T84_01075, partial [Thermoleophilia bacterium]|nr:hypothetical protein [Thermoleophilia bacterium]